MIKKIIRMIISCLKKDYCNKIGNCIPLVNSQIEREPEINKMFEMSAMVDWILIVFALKI